MLREYRQIRMGEGEQFFGAEIDPEGNVRAINQEGGWEDVLGAPELPSGMIESMIAVLTRAKELANENV